MGRPHPTLGHPGLKTKEKVSTMPGQVAFTVWASVPGKLLKDTEVSLVALLPEPGPETKTATGMAGAAVLCCKLVTCRIAWK